MDRQRRYIDERRDAAAALVDHLKAQLARYRLDSSEAAEAMSDLGWIASRVLWTAWTPNSESAC